MGYFQEVSSLAAPLPPCKIGINGFGRIGRNVLRASLLRTDVVIVAINHTCASIEDVIHLITHDSTHGPLTRHLSRASKVTALPNGNLLINGREIAMFSQRNVEKIDWAAHGAEYIAECTGHFKTIAQASKHVDFSHAKKVLISAPSPDAPTFVYRVNSDGYRNQRQYNVFSCASCTTNCLAPIAKVLDEKFGIVQAFMTTVHASTQSQHVLDGYSKKDRRAGRSVIGNIIPTSTGAAQAIRLVLPQLDGKFSGISIRVPTSNVSMVDLNVNTATATSLEEILGAFREAAGDALLGVLSVEDEELVSCDFLSHPSSAIVDAKASVQLNPNFFKIIAWYDNEWGYSNRLLDMLAFMQKTDLECETVPISLKKGVETVPVVQPVEIPIVA